MAELVKRFIHTCKRCGYLWVSKNEHPRTCTNCNSPWWDIERKNKKEEV